MANRQGNLRSRRRTLRDATVLGGSSAGAEAAAPEASSSDALLDGLKRFLDEAASKSGMDAGQLKGFLFERIEAARINVNAVRKGLDVRARLTADSPGGGTDPRVDIQVMRNGRVVEEIQAKASGDPAWLARAVSQPKYDGTTRLVPRDMAETVNQKLPDSVQVVGKLEQSGASSGGTTMDELREATKNPPLYALGRGGMQIAREAATTGGYAAAAGAIFGGGLSSIQNAYAFSQGEIGRSEALMNVKSDTVRSGVRSGAAGVLGTVIRHGAGKAGLTTFTKANVATAVGAATIEAAGIVNDYARGRISGDAVAEKLGQTGCTTVAAIYLGARAGASFGPVGAVVGSVAGYALAAMVYQSCIQFIREGSQTQDEGERVAALGYEAAWVLGQQRWQMEGELANLPNDLGGHFHGQFADIDRTLVTEQTDDALQAMGRLLRLFGERLAK